jgi:hypothetical protein
LSFLNAFILENPSLLKGIETTAPSIKFCNPIPKASTLARVIVTVSGFPDKALKATPTAKPSEILCKVITRTSKILLCHEVFSLRQKKGFYTVGYKNL